MNYIKEINSFIDWLEINPLEATTQTLWLHVMAIANKSGWPEWFTIANLSLMAKVGISENTLIKHRNILIQKGRLEYRNQGKQKAGKYKIVSFTSIFEVNLEVKKPITSNIEVLREVNLEVNREVSPSALYKLNETKLDISTSTNTSNIEVSNFDKDFSELAKLYQQCGFVVNGTTSDWIRDVKERYGYEWVKNSLLEAEKKGKRTKLYVEGILENWHIGGGMKLSRDKNSSSQPKVVTAKKTRFHNFGGRSENYAADELEQIVARKRREYSKKLEKEDNLE